MKLMKMKLLDSLIGNIGDATLTLRNQVQIACVQVIGYSILHGDTGPANRLIAAIADKKTIRKDSVIAYCEQYGNLAWMQKSLPQGEKPHFAHRKTDKVFNDEYLKLLDANHWTEAKREADPVSIFDVDVEFDKFLKRLNKLSGDANITMKNRKLLDELAATQAKYNARLVLGEAADKPVMSDANTVVLPPPQQAAA